MSLRHYTLVTTPLSRPLVTTPFHDPVLLVPGVVLSALLSLALSSPSAEVVGAARRAAADREEEHRHVRRLEGVLFLSLARSLVRSLSHRLLKI
jgi:hypothetical protein